MRNFLKVAVFSLLTIGFFAGFANFGIPEINPAAPPEDEELDLGAMSLDEFIAVGERVFNGKGTCTLCHNALGGRAPLLDNVAAAAAERLGDPRYAGEATDPESYLYESMVDPSAYVVVGFGKAGSNDTESPMPDVTGGGIGMSAAETWAVIAYLQDLGGVEVTVEIPTGAEEESTQQQDTAPATPRAALAGADEIVTKLSCGACHVIAGQRGALGPDLTRIGGQRDKEYLRRAILDPNADIAEGYQPNMMPGIYGEQLYAGELETLVEYLAGLR